MPVVFVAGNHEYYHASYRESQTAAACFDAVGNVHYLEDERVQLDGVLFCGTTLWTDFALFGKDWAEAGMHSAADRMNDFRLIDYSRHPYERFRPVHTFRMHHGSRSFLKDTLAKYRGHKIVVVTHHAPSMYSVEEKYKSDLLSTAFASNLDDLMAPGGPALWVHGHVHHFVDYMLNDTRVLANPRGYPYEESYRNFDWGLVIEV